MSWDWTSDPFWIRRWMLEPSVLRSSLELPVLNPQPRPSAAASRTKSPDSSQELALQPSSILEGLPRIKFDPAGSSSGAFPVDGSDLFLGNGRLT